MKDQRAMKAGECVYIAMAIKTEIELKHNLPLSLPSIKLQWASGQIGTLPVFATYDKAKAWAEGIYDIKTVVLKADFTPSTPVSP